MPIELAQRTADLDRGHDAIVKKDESAFAIDISFGDASCRLTTINPVGFTPAGGHNLLCRHANARVATTLTLGRSLRRVNVRSEPDQVESGHVTW